MSHSVGLAAFTMILLRCDDHYLMLKRGQHKRFAPGRWTGIGGKVEANEFDDPLASAARELEEETGIPVDRVRRFALRRALLQHRPGFPITTLLYFTGDIEVRIDAQCDEGTLHWVPETELQQLDIIENTRLVIPRLIEDMQRRPDADSSVTTGAASFAPDGSLRSVLWAE